MNAQILHALLFCPSPEGFWGLNAIFWGPPGVGKTHMIRDAVSQLGMPFERLSPAERGEGAFGVVPVPGADGLLHYPPPAWSQRFINGGLIFLDEINTAPPALQAPLLGLSQLRTLGGYTFPARTRVIAAANETQDAAGGWDLAPALANRFGHFNFQGLEPDEWTVALLGGFYTPHEEVTTTAEVEEARVLAAWPSALANASGLMAGFIRRRPELLDKRPERASGQASRAWPSRRSVHYAVHALASAMVHRLSEIDTDTLVAGFVGQSWVTEFAVWRANMDLPDPADLLDGKVNFTHDPRRLDRTIAVLDACAALVVPEKAVRRKERGNRCWELVGTALKDAADCAIPAARALIKARLLDKYQFPASVTVRDRLLPMLVASGLAPKAV